MVGRWSRLFLGALVFVGLGAGRAVAQSCPYSGPVSASLETRTYRDTTLNFAFEIPANYRAMGLSNGRVAFYDPATFDHVQCAVRRGVKPQGNPAAMLDLRSVPAGEDDLLVLTQRARPWLVLYEPTYEAVAETGLAEAAAFGGIPVLRYQYVHEIYKNTVIALSFRSPNGQWLVTVEGGPTSPVLPLLFSTLRP